MADPVTVVAGLPIPSTSPLFLAVVGVHVLAGLVCVVAGAAAMLSPKRAGRHPRFGTIYYAGLAGVFLTAGGLAAMRWREDYRLFILGALALAAATIAREARRRLWTHWPRLHLTGMGASYILLLTAFYVDNGPNLPIWRDFPPIAYWIAPSLVGIPIIVWAFWRHPIVRR